MLLVLLLFFLHDGKIGYVYQIVHLNHSGINVLENKIFQNSFTYKKQPRKYQSINYLNIASDVAAPVAQILLLNVFQFNRCFPLNTHSEF